MTESSPFAPDRLAAIRANYAPRSLSKHDLLDDDYLLARERLHRVYYAPLGAWPQATATLILVGLTPGLSQATLAARLFATTPATIRDDETAYDALLREHVAFQGSMRTNLCTMLDRLGLPKALGVCRTELLFDRESDLIAATSALVYPVFTGAERRNFSGAGSDLAGIAVFRRMLEELLAPRLAVAPSALIVPFGKAAASGVRHLSEAGSVSGDRVLTGFPHPSGANGHRKRAFEESRERLAAAIAHWLADRAVAGPPQRDGRYRTLAGTSGVPTCSGRKPTPTA